MQASSTTSIVLTGGGQPVTIDGVRRAAARVDEAIAATIVERQQLDARVTALQEQSNRLKKQLDLLTQVEALQAQIESTEPSAPRAAALEAPAAAPTPAVALESASSKRKRDLTGTSDAMRKPRAAPNAAVGSRPLPIAINASHPVAQTIDSPATPRPCASSYVYRAHSRVPRALHVCGDRHLLSTSIDGEMHLWRTDVDQMPAAADSSGHRGPCRPVQVAGMHTSSFHIGANALCVEHTEWMDDGRTIIGCAFRGASWPVEQSRHGLSAATKTAETSRPLPHVVCINVAPMLNATAPSAPQYATKLPHGVSTELARQSKRESTVAVPFSVRFRSASVGGSGIGDTATSLHGVMFASKVHDKEVTCFTSEWRQSTHQRLLLAGSTDHVVACWGDVQPDLVGAVRRSRRQTSVLHRRHTAAVRALLHQKSNHMVLSGGADGRVFGYDAYSQQVSMAHDISTICAEYENGGHQSQTRTLARVCHLEESVNRVVLVCCVTQTQPHMLLMDGRLDLPHSHFTAPASSSDRKKRTSMYTRPHWSPTGHEITFPADDGTVYVWDLRMMRAPQSMGPPRVYSVHSGARVVDTQWIDVGGQQQLATIGGDKSLGIHDVHLP